LIDNDRDASPFADGTNAPGLLRGKISAAAVGECGHWPLIPPIRDKRNAGERRNEIATNWVKRA
jgi:hypothetical protein